MFVLIILIDFEHKIYYDTIVLLFYCHKRIILFKKKKYQVYHSREELETRFP